ncbi:hypothetical protein P692DRAFT_20183978 [Suillus brevipes Sb2]|nr:hypothetical protein P692DRAFT_20183978 [Suillus brevipes Sb2]
MFLTSPLFLSYWLFYVYYINSIKMQARVMRASFPSKSDTLTRTRQGAYFRGTST